MANVCGKNGVRCVFARVRGACVEDAGNSEGRSGEWLCS